MAAIISVAGSIESRVNFQQRFRRKGEQFSRDPEMAFATARNDSHRVSSAGTFYAMSIRSGSGYYI